MRTVPVWISIAVLAATAQLAEAKPKKGKGKKPQTKAQQIKAHMNRATAAHKAGNFDVALTELTAAYELDPQPKLLFAIAQVDAKLDRCSDAIDNYEKFLATTKDKKKKSIVKQAIASCKTKIAEAEPAPATDTPAAGDKVFRDKKPDEPVAPAASTETPVTPPAEPAPSPTPEPAAGSPPAAEDAPPGMAPPQVDTGAHVRSHWYKDPIGDVLVVGGLAAGVGSLVLYVRARHDLDDAEAAPSIDDYPGFLDQAHDHRTYSIVLAGVSGALIVGGIVRYALHHSGERKAVAVTPTSGGGLVTYGGSF